MYDKQKKESEVLYLKYFYSSKRTNQIMITVGEVDDTTDFAMGELLLTLRLR